MAGVIVEFSQPWLEKYTRIPFPMELVLIVAGVFAATGLELKKSYGTMDIGYIPKGYAKFLALKHKLKFGFF